MGHLKLLGHMMREGFENLILTGQIDGKSERGNLRLTYLESFNKWLPEPDLGEMHRKQHSIL